MRVIGLGARRGGQRRRILGLMLGLLISGPGLPCVAAQETASTPAVDTTRITITGDVRAPLSLTTEELAQYPAESVDVTFELSGAQVTHTFTGTRLLGLIEQAGLLAPRDTRYPLLQHYIVATSKDGYRIIIAGGELDPFFSAVPYLVAWEIDGQPLAAEDAPAFLVAPYDYLDGRMVWGLTTIEVHSIGEKIPNG